MRRNLIIIVMIFVGAIITLILGNIIIIGDKITTVFNYKYTETIYYIVIVGLILYFIIKPIVKIHFAPEIPKFDIDNKCETKELRDFANKLANNCYYISDSKERVKHRKILKNNIEKYSANNIELSAIIDKEIQRRIKGDEASNITGINQRIKEWATTVLMVTAVSQNGKIDALSVLYLNYKMIEDIIHLSGFRPTKAQLFKQYVRVLSTSLVSYVISDMLNDIDDIDFNIDDADGTSVEGFSLFSILSNIKIPGFIVASTLDGITNSLMTLRIGYVTKSYLIEGFDSKDTNRKTIKRQAVKDAVISMPSIIAQSSSVLGKSVSDKLIRIFTNKSSSVDSKC